MKKRPAPKKRPGLPRVPYEVRQATLLAARYGILLIVPDPKRWEFYDADNGRLLVSYHVRTQLAYRSGCRGGPRKVLLPFGNVVAAVRKVKQGAPDAPWGE
jgi:hypothetical protein